jgi:HNH endonuclease
MPAYPPGSFTKNFGWNLSPPGLNRLHEVIRAGFGGGIRRVTRKFFRSHCQLTDPNRQLVPINFFLHNTIVRGTNYVTVDELVRHAIYNPHSRRFDHLALFSLHLARMGLRVGVAGDSRGAAFTNEFVRTRLWNDGGWQSKRLREREVERAFERTVVAQASGTVHKCMTNYLYIMEMMGLRGQRTRFINTQIEEWVGPGLFTAFDRYALDRTGSGELTQAELLSMVKSDELHKLMGTTEAYLDSTSQLIAAEYLDLGGLDRITVPAELDATGAAIVASVATSAADSARTWSDEDAQDTAMVLRRLQEAQAQIRNAQHVRELKALYRNACIFCGKQMVIGVDPSKHYSEAAHIKPVGHPHNGPDRKDNMLILCPEHHLQFDRGLLRIDRRMGGALIIVSKIPGDPLNEKTLLLRRPHSLNGDYVLWHYQFWRL